MTTATVINRGSGDGPFRRYVDLRVEIVIGSFDTEDRRQRAEASVFDMPMTDAQLEAQLDLFEAQVKWALLSLAEPRLHERVSRVRHPARVDQVACYARRKRQQPLRFATHPLQVRDTRRLRLGGINVGLLTPGAELIPFCDKLGEIPRTVDQADAASRHVLSARHEEGVLNVLAGNQATRTRTFRCSSASASTWTPSNPKRTRTSWPHKGRRKALTGASRFKNSWRFHDCSDRESEPRRRASDSDARPGLPTRA
jgi:hypothetical protein